MCEREVVLLTGGTGAIGPAIAAELLASGVAEKLFVLIRPGSVGLARRFEEFLTCVDHEMTERPHGRFNWRSALTPVAGDLLRPQLGLDRFSRSLVRQQATAIVHAAADTNFIAPLDQQTAINVGGVRRVIDLARSCRQSIQTLLLSTICTSGRTEGRIFERPITSPPDFINTYEQTKWQAEQLALASDVPLGIARVGIVLGSSASGMVHRPGALHAMIRWLGRGLVPAIPGNDQSRLDVISSECVGRFVASALTRGWADKSIFNLCAGDDAPYLTDFSEATWSVLFPGEPLRNTHNRSEPLLISHEDFESMRLNLTDRRDRATRGALDALSAFVPMLPLARVFDTANARQIDATLDDWRQTLIRVLRRGETQYRRAVA